MKRVFTLSIALIILASFLVSAAPSDIIGEQIGVNPQNIPQDIQTAKEDYLKQNWEEIIINNAVLGKVHTFFSSISPVFQILFGQPYSLSPRLFFVILLFIYLITRIDSALHSLSLFNRPAQIALAIGTGIILAQLNVLALVVAGFAKIVSSPEGWIMRVIAILFSVVIIFVMHFLINKGIFAIKQTKKGKEEAEKGNTIGQIREFLKGIKEGQKLEE